MTLNDSWFGECSFSKYQASTYSTWSVFPWQVSSPLYSTKVSQSIVSPLHSSVQSKTKALWYYCCNNSAIENFFHVFRAWSKHNLEEFKTDMQTWDGSHGFAWLLGILPTPQVFRWGYVNVEKSPWLLSWNIKFSPK